jgi:hypothetical protein
MIARYQHLRRYPQVFLAMTGLRVAEFDRLAQDGLPRYAQAETQRHQAIPLPRGASRARRRAIGAGHPFTLARRDHLLLTVIWLRLYPTNEVLAYLFGISDSTVARLLARLLPLLAAAGQDTMRMPDPGRTHRRQLDVLLRELPELGVVIDTFEQPVQRPEGRQAGSVAEGGRGRPVGEAEPGAAPPPKQADRWYSGKKKRHTIKSQLAVNRHSGEIVDVAESVPGPTADITLLKESGVLRRLPEGVSGEGDLAYVGIAKEHPTGLGYTPRRKPRGKDKHRPRGQDRAQPAEDKAYNQAFAKSRIIVEHTIGRVRRYQAVTAPDRHHRQGHTERVRAIAGLVNRQLAARMPYLVH